MTYPAGPLAVRVWRLIGPKWQARPFSGEGARINGGRWNAIGEPALYLATDPATAVAEFYQSVPKPGLLAPYDLDARTIADLTDGAGKPGDEHIAAALAADWKTIARIQRRDPPSWRLARQLQAMGAEGALVPSLQSAGGVNLVLWRWHDAATPGEGAALALLDPEQALTGRQRG